MEATIRRKTYTGACNILPPEIKAIPAGGTVATVLYDRAIDGAAGKLVFTNVGVNPFFYCLNGEAGANSYHGIVSGGAAAVDGNGGVVSFTRDTPIDAAAISKLTAYSTGGTSVATIKFIRTDV